MSDRITMGRHTNQAYVLRLWRDSAGSPLRATLLTITTPHHQYHFTDLDELQSFLTAQTSMPIASKLHGIPDSLVHDQSHCTLDED